jgi:hypothetical protein
MRLDPNDAKAVVSILVGDALNQAGQHFPIGWLRLRLHDGYRTGLVGRTLASAAHVAIQQPCHRDDFRDIRSTPPPSDSPSRRHTTMGAVVQTDTPYAPYAPNYGCGRRLEKILHRLHDTGDHRSQRLTVNTLE